jgi:hypothetical protein
VKLRGVKPKRDEWYYEKKIYVVKTKFDCIIFKEKLDVTLENCKKLNKKGFKLNQIQKIFYCTVPNGTLFKLIKIGIRTSNYCVVG